MAKTVTDRTPTRSIRLDDEAYEALRAAAAGHGSINKLVRAMFVTPAVTRENRGVRFPKPTPGQTAWIINGKERVEIPPEEQIPIPAATAIRDAVEAEQDRMRRGLNGNGAPPHSELKIEYES